jgi:hypothetical protein
MPVDRSARPPRPPRPPRPETLTEEQRHHRHDAIELMLTNPQMGGGDRLDVFRAFLPPDLRNAIGRSHPEMVPAVAQAALEFPTEEQQGWMRQVLTNHALDWTAQYGSAASIGKLARSISISGLPMEERADRLETLLNLRGPACAAVAESLNASAIATTAYAMANCWPEHLEEKWLETLQNVVLSDACVAEVARSGCHSHLSSTAWAATLFPDKDRRTDALRALLTEKNCSILQNHASLHPNSLAVAVFSAQHLPPAECGPVLEKLMSSNAVSAVLRERDGYSIASLALGAWHLLPGQRAEALSRLMTTKTCEWVRDLKSKNAMGMMREAVEQLPEDSKLRHEMLEILLSDQGLGSKQNLSPEKEADIRQWADGWIKENAKVDKLVDALYQILQNTSATAEKKSTDLKDQLSREGGDCTIAASSLNPAAIVTTAYTMANHLQSDLAEVEGKWSKAFQSLYSDECLEAVMANEALGVELMIASAMSLPDESLRTTVLKKLLTDEQCAWFQQEATAIPDQLATTVNAALCLPEQDCQRVLARLVTEETCRAVAKTGNETFLGFMREGAKQLPDGPHRQAVLKALEPVPQWQRALDARPGYPKRSRDRVPSPGGH